MAKMHWQPGLFPEPHWGAHDAPPDLTRIEAPSARIEAPNPSMYSRLGGGNQPQCPTLLGAFDASVLGDFSRLRCFDPRAPPWKPGALPLADLELGTVMHSDRDTADSRDEQRMCGPEFVGYKCYTGV